MVPLVDNSNENKILLFRLEATLPMGKDSIIVYGKLLIRKNSAYSLGILI